MTSARASKPIKRDRQRITRTACEPCREKRAKCDGEKPCGRCQTRNLDCHFTQRTWASKRSLQDEAAALREQLQRRDGILDAIAASDASGDEIIRLLREGGISYDEAFERIHDGETGSNIDAMDTSIPKRHGPGVCDCETCWSPSTIGSNMMSSASVHSPFSFMDNPLTDDAISQPSTISQPATTPDQIPQHMPQQPDALQQQMNPMQSIPWAGAGPDINTFGQMLDGSEMPPIAPGHPAECPTIIDPTLWPPVTSSDPLGQPMLNSWTGLMGDPAHTKNKPNFGVVG